ncbi:DUF1345 domain-containing protein [Paracoccus sp. p4-l81]|uniref:DUF1345 domain-containing protein n=1 Tax=unclassified Paracoccus (in: a-proteobacteria) TaxID=2688777 RepID=UPI0035B7C2B6
MRGIWARHRRFLLALVAGLAAAAILSRLPLALTGGDLALLGTDTAFAGYLIGAALLARRLTPATLRHRAVQADEGGLLIAPLAVAVLAVSLTAVFQALGGGGRLHAGLALASVPLGWAMLHVLAGFHYAHLFYSQGPTRHGLSFPGTDQPGIGDFLYFSMGIGMTAQVSDVVVTSPALRRLVTAHAALSFFYNTVLLALAVSAAGAMVG